MATIKDEAEVLVKINDEEAKKKLPALQQKVKDLNKQFDELRNNNAPNDKIKEVGKELKKTYEQAEALRKRTQGIDEAMQNISLSTPKELRSLMAQINRELNSGYIERGTKEWDEYCDKLKQVKTELKKIADEQKVVTDSGLSFKDMLDIGGDISMISASLLQVKDSIADFIRDNTQSYIALDAELANVQKFTGLAREGVEELNTEFKEIDTRTSIIELNKLAEEAGRLGKTSQEDILGFAKAADIINVALDDLGEGATLEISKLTNIFGDEKALGTERSMLAVGSVINELSQNCTAAAPYLANFTKRLAGVGAQADMTIPQIMGFAAVLDSQGQAVEMSATAVSQLITKMFQDPAKIAKAVGLDIQEFTNLVKTDTNAALLTLLERLNSFGSMDVLAPLFKEMGTDGARASAVLASLAGNIDMVREQQEIATQAYNEATSVVKEFTVQNETEEAKLEKKRKKYEEVKVALGKELLPVMSSFVSTGSMMAKLLLSLIQFTKEHHKAIISIAAGLAAYTITVKAHTIATTATTVATKAWNLLTKAGTTLQAAYKIVLYATTLAYAKLTSNTVMATTAQTALNTAMKSNPIGLIIGAITTAAVAIWNYSKKVDEANKKEKELAKTRREKTKEYSDVSAMAAEEAQKELDKLDELYNLTQDYNASQQERVNAAQKLIELYPGYFGQLNTEAILAGKAKTKYDELTQSIINGARARAAAAKLEENEVLRIEKEIQLQQYEQDILAADAARLRTQQNFELSQQREKDVWEGELNSDNPYHQRSDHAIQYRIKGARAIAVNEVTDEILEAEKEAKEQIEVLQNEMAALDDANRLLLDIIEDNKNNPFAGNKGSGGNGDDGGEGVAQDWLDRENAINRTAYATGQINYEEFLEKKHKILLAYYDKMLQDTSLSETERLGILADKAEEELNWRKKQQEESLQQSLADIDKEYENTKARETAWCYNIANANYGNEKILHEKLFQANVEYLKEKEQLYRAQGNNTEADKMLLEREQLVNNEKLRKQKEFLRLLNNYRRQYDELSLEERKTAELTTLEAIYQQKLMTEEEYQQKKKAIEDKYRGEEEKEAYNVSDGGGWGDKTKDLYYSISDLIDNVTAKGKLSFEDIGKAAVAAWSMAGAALQTYGNYVQAECDLEVAKVEKKYEAQIKAAGNNDRKVKQLEKERDKEIAQIKSKANKKAMKIEIAQAVAQTAMAAINAYSSAAAVPVVGHILAPIAAAMAVAAGMMQIATIKKQHQAQELGYYKGGFTRRSLNDHDEVGVVHANEFVANARATANPVLTPLFNLIDYAQKNNTVSSLTAADVSSALGTGAVISASSSTTGENTIKLLSVAASIEASAKVIERLNRKLDEGIESYMIMDGEDGFHSKHTKYLELLNNSKR